MLSSSYQLLPDIFRPPLQLRPFEHLNCAPCGGAVALHFLLHPSTKPHAFTNGLVHFEIYHVTSPSQPLLER